jgi:hypothetical protein
MRPRRQDAGAGALGAAPLGRLPLGAGAAPFAPACSACAIKASAFSRVSTPCSTSALTRAIVVSRSFRNSSASSAKLGAEADSSTSTSA